MALLSARHQSLLNRFFGRLAYQIKLGDLIADALAVAATELTSIGAGKILVGAATTGLATARDMSGDVTIGNTGITTIGAKKVLDTMTAIADGKILIGDAGGAGAAQTLSGDVTVSRTGVTAIGAKKVLDTMIALANGKILVGDSGGAADEQTMSGDITMTNGGVTAIGANKVLTAMINAGAVTQAKLANGSDGTVIEAFKDRFLCCGIAGVGACTGSGGDVNYLMTPYNSFEWYVMGTQTILGPLWVAAGGVDFAMDQTANDGFEFTQGVTADCRVAKVIGTSNAKFRCKVAMTYAGGNGSDTLLIGWRKAEAYNGTYTNYTDYCAVGLNTADQDIMILKGVGGTDTSTDTTQNTATTQYIDVEITIGNEAYLQTAINLANGLKATMNTHFADATEHVTAVQASVSTADATTTTSLIALTTALMAAFVIHNADAQLAAAWVYHDDQANADDALTSAVAPVSLSECVTKLNDLKVKLNLHVARGGAGECHADGDSGVCAVVDACNTYIQIGNNAALADPTVTSAYNFTNALTVIPFVHFLQDTDVCSVMKIMNWEVTDLTTSTT